MLQVLAHNTIVTIVLRRRRADSAWLSQCIERANDALDKMDPGRAANFF